MNRLFAGLLLWSALIGGAGTVWADDAAKTPAVAPDFNTHVVPIFKKYCIGCHNADEKEGGLILESFDMALKGGKRGGVIVPGKSDKSRLTFTIEKKVKPVMPPQGNEGPKVEEIAILKAWIDAGAKGPSGEAPDPTLLVTPKIATAANVRQPIQSIAWSRDVATIAIARQKQAELFRIPTSEELPNRALAASSGRLIRELAGMRGVINEIGVSPDVSFVFVAAGEPGLFGEVRLFKVSDGTLIRTIQGHRDAIYAVELSPDGKLLATGSYDQKIKLWNVRPVKSYELFTGITTPFMTLRFIPAVQFSRRQAVIER